MPSDSFGGFVVSNLRPIDDLAKEYAKYKAACLNSFYSVLDKSVITWKPDGCDVSHDERCDPAGAWYASGWEWKFEADGCRINIATRFESFIAHSSLQQGEWPMMSGRCWTGVRILNGHQTTQRDWLLRKAREARVPTQPIDASDKPLCLWRPFPALGSASLEVFRERITTDAGKTANEIVAELKEWNEYLKLMRSASSGEPWGPTAS